MPSRPLVLGLFLLPGIGALSGCVVPAEGGEGEPVSLSRQAIMGGTPDPGDPNVVDVVWNTSQGTGFCTGSLLAQNMVLTAHHCVSNLLPAGTTSVDCGTTTFSAPDSPTSFYVSTKEILNLTNITANNFYSVQEVLVPPGGSKLCGDDQAIYILSNSIPASEAVPLVPRVDVPVTPGEAYTAIGFGITSDSASDNGTRRKLTGLKVECGGTGCSATYGSQINTQHEWGGDHGTCEGDSGGPALDSLNRVFGVTSRGGTGCSSPIYGDVYSWADWIKNTALHAAEVGNYTAPSWATGWPTDPAYADTPLGGACGSAATCPSNYCLADQGGEYCTRLCEDAAPCPNGYSCNTVEGVPLCQRPPPPPPGSGRSSGCALPAGEPAAPSPWLLAAGVGMLAWRRRRRG
jgi:MYXO-CTERM domain-containing protein